MPIYRQVPSRPQRARTRPNLASFRQVDAESEIAFSKKDETFQESQGILSPLRLPVPPRPLVDLLGPGKCYAADPKCYAKPVHVASFTRLKARTTLASFSTCRV
jgi:hypothetical protein